MARELPGSHTQVQPARRGYGALLWDGEAVGRSWRGCHDSRPRMYVCTVRRVYAAAKVSPGKASA